MVSTLCSPPRYAVAPDAHRSEAVQMILALAVAVSSAKEVVGNAASMRGESVWPHHVF